MEKRSIVFYDGDCGLCNGTVQMIWQRDEGGVFYFSALQSDFAQEFLHRKGVEQITMDTMYVYDSGEVFTRSRAVAQIGRKLRGKRFSLGVWLIEVFPFKSWLDAIYDLIAQNRHHFARKQTCILPPTEVRERFID